MPKGKRLYPRHEDIDIYVAIDVDFLNKYLKSSRRKEGAFFPSMWIKQFLLFLFVLLYLEKRNEINVQFIIFIQLFYKFNDVSLCHRDHSKCRFFFFHPLNKNIANWYQ